jgi:ectoine hydroxylase-related dioxygenase (phytanoyl-CoA dioxygenase family)
VKEERMTGIATTWLSVEDCDLGELDQLVGTVTELADYPHALETRENVPVYDMPSLLVATERVRAVGGQVERARRALQQEIARALSEGPGVVVLAGAFTPDVVDRATEAFEAMIEREREVDGTRGDHFAAAGANDRVWNALEKLAVADPDAFVDYYSNETLALVCSAWLGSGYQITSQINVVRPGGPAQSVHRDYHLGFMSNEAAAGYPAFVHQLSPLLTLQGAVAHCDMPLESGPTLYLPYSHKLLSGYLAWRRPDFRQYFEDARVQLPLAKGDAVFFNPALFHAAGSNTSTDIRRMANLLQVSSAFGRAMESVDRARVVVATYPALLRRAESGVDERALRNAVDAAADGYAFPTNLDLDPPVDGLSPRTQAELAWQALTERWDEPTLRAAIGDQAARRRSS